MSNLTFARTDNSVLGRWWWTMDWWLMGTVLTLIAIGIVMLMAAGPAAAARIHADPFLFVRKQYIIIPFAIILMVGLSMLSTDHVRRLAAIGFTLSIIALVLVPFIGSDIKGASRWLYIGGLSIQPSEFMKPCFAVVIGWIFASRHTIHKFPALPIAALVLIGTIGLLALQPDLGQSILVTAIWIAQFVISGYPIVYGLVLIFGLLLAVTGSYFVFSHVQRRVDAFLYPETSDTYQIEKSLQAFRDGGLFGRGPGEGMVKEALPDSHTDFIFAVAGEELGMFVCLAIVGLYAFLVIRALTVAMRETNLFVISAVGGLVTMFGMQAIINMGSSLNLIPTKGMTLPFISYGGSSNMGLALGMGFLLALTRKRTAALPGGRA